MSKHIYEGSLIIIKIISFLVFLLSIIGIFSGFVDEYKWISLVVMVLLYLAYRYIANDNRTISNLIVFTLITIGAKVILTIFPIFALGGLSTQGSNYLKTTKDDPYMKKLRQDAVKEKTKLDRLCGNDIDCRLRLFNQTTQEMKSNKTSYNKGTFSLTVDTNPSNAKVQIMNIRPKYYDGIQLKKGTYRIRVSKKGYNTENYTLDHHKDSKYNITLTSKKMSNQNNYTIYTKGNKVIYKILDRNPCYITYKRDRSFVSNTCNYHINSKGQKIYCTKGRKVCKTSYEIVQALGLK